MIAIEFLQKQLYLLYLLKGESNRLGGCANVAGNLKSLGAEPIILGFVGKDYNTVKIRQNS